SGNVREILFEKRHGINSPSSRPSEALRGGQKVGPVRSARTTQNKHLTGNQPIALPTQIPTQNATLFLLPRPLLRRRRLGRRTRLDALLRGGGGAAPFLTANLPSWKISGR